MIDLSDYPLARCNEACSRYMGHVDWDRISEEAHTNHAAYFDVSDSLPLFSHLELDEEYALYCYVTHEYHGLWGRVAAVKKCEPLEPIVLDGGRNGFFQGPEFELPDSSVPPMEAIYHDGTPHGYFEALLADMFFHALPYVRFEQEHWDNCITRPPKRFDLDWDIFEKLTDWKPYMCTDRYGGVTVSMCWHHFENGFGSSDGCDTVRRSQHHFERSLGFHNFIERRKSMSNMYKSHIDDDKRYRDGRHCCVARERSITIATQKDWQTLQKQRDNRIATPGDYEVRL